MFFVTAFTHFTPDDEKLRMYASFYLQLRTKMTSKARDAFFDECFSRSVRFILPDGMCDRDQLETFDMILNGIEHSITDFTGWQDRIRENNISPDFLGGVLDRGSMGPIHSESPVKSFPDPFGKDPHSIMHLYEKVGPVHSTLNDETMEVILYFPWTLYALSRSSRNKVLTFEKARTYVWMLKFYENFTVWILDTNARRIFGSTVYHAVFRQIVSNINSACPELTKYTDRFLKYALRITRPKNATEPKNDDWYTSD
jgi:hypothetical protein